MTLICPALTAEHASEIVLKYLIQGRWDYGTCFNVNLPDVEPDSIKDIAITRQGEGNLNNIGVIGVRLENGNYPTLRLYFVQQWRRMRDQQFINRDSFLLKRLNGSFYINRIPECYRRRM